jgi:hypothetical protein
MLVLILLSLSGRKLECSTSLPLVGFKEYSFTFTSAAFRTILNVLPILLPFFTPVKRTQANQTYLRGPINQASHYKTQFDNHSEPDYVCIFDFIFKTDLLKKRRKVYDQKLEQAMQAQRKGDIKTYALLTAESEAIWTQIEQITAQLN